MASALSLPDWTWPRVAVAVSMISGTLAAHRLGHRRRRRLVGHADQRRAGLGLEQLVDQARRRAGQSDVDLFGLRLGRRDQLGDGLGRELRIGEITIGSMPTG